jgi:DNA-directed RNA polymerase specialized sigma24 family protein
MTGPEIAEALGCAEGTVKKSLFRSVEKLRASLGLGVETRGERVPLGASGKG